MKVSNPQRVVFPGAGITKGDVVGYYRRVGDRMLHHAAGRPLTLERYPRGLAGEGFMQKNAAAHFPASIERVEVPRRGGTTVYPVVHAAEDLAYLANQGTITFHVWTSRLPHLDLPDRIVLDLDPPEGDVAEVRRAAVVVREFLTEIGLTSQPVATGSKGFHVVAPVVASPAAARLAELMHGAAQLLGTRHPELLTAEFRKEERRGRIFVDWLRNNPGQTGVCPWSLRARPEAPAAVPITWEELDTATPAGSGLATIETRLAVPDPLAALDATPSDPTAAHVALEAALAAAHITPPPFDRFRS